MKRKVKYSNYDHTLTVALLGITVKTYPNQNVPKSKRTLVESKFTQVRSKCTKVESKRTRKCTHDNYITSISVQFNRNYVFIILMIFYSAERIMWLWDNFRCVEFFFFLSVLQNIEHY